jgi:hypothetical protein
MIQSVVRREMINGEQVVGLRTFPLTSQSLACCVIYPVTGRGIMILNVLRLAPPLCALTRIERCKELMLQVFKYKWS